MALDTELKTEKPEIDKSDPVWSAAVNMHADNEKLTDEQRERAEIKTYRRLTEKVASDVDPVTAILATDQTDWSAITNPLKTAFMYFIGFASENFAPLNKHLVAMEYAVQPGQEEVFFANMKNPKGGAISSLDTASERLKKQFPEAAAETYANLDHAPALVTQPKASA